MKKNARITVNLEPPVAAELGKRATAAGRSLANTAEQAIKHYLSDTTYDDLALVILKAAERIRREQGTA